MQIALDARDLALVISGAFACAGAAGLLARRRPAPGPAGTLLLAAVALVAGANYYLLAPDPVAHVKTWDVKHSFFGAKYARELGYFRIYECILLFDAGDRGVHAGVASVHDLRTPRGMLSRREVLARTDCAERFSPERREEFQRDLAFFDSLPRQPIADRWFADNGYNLTPFFTAVVGPVLNALPPSYGLLLSLSLVDVVLSLAALAVVCRTFGLRWGLLVAIFFFTNFSNRFEAMGGAILRFAWLSLLLVSVCAFRSGRPRAAGAALAGATLFQVFPAVFAVGLWLAAALAWRREGRAPGWLAPFTGAFAATFAAGLVPSLAVAGPEACREFVEKLALHNLQLSQYRVGLKLLPALPWPPTAEVDYGAALARLQARLPLFALAAGAYVAGALSLVRRLDPLAFSLVLGTVVLFVLTPVHYYFGSLVLLFLVGRRPDDPAPRTIRTLLFTLSAGAYLVFAASDGSLPLTNSYWLSTALALLLPPTLTTLHLFNNGDVVE